MIDLSDEVFQNCMCAIMHIQARGFHALRMKLSDAGSIAATQICDSYNYSA